MDQIQAIFLNLFYLKYMYSVLNPIFLSPQVLGICSRSCFCCQPSLKLMCNGLLRSIKNYFCCHLFPKGDRGAGNGSSGRIRKQCPGGGGPMIRSSSRSFAPSNLFNERIYELNDNSGSVMTDHTPTFASNYHQPFRGVDSDAMIHSRTMQSQVCL